MLTLTTSMSVTPLRSSRPILFTLRRSITSASSSLEMTLPTLTPSAYPLRPVEIPPPLCILCHNITTLAAGHAAAPPVYHTGPHAAGAADTDMLRAQSVFVLNPGIASDFLQQEPAGRYTLQGFYQHFLQTDLASGVPAEVAGPWPNGGASPALGMLATPPRAP